MTKYNDIFGDTETCSSLDNPFVYDGFMHCRSTDESVNAVINEYFFDHEKFATAYYAKKRPQYIDDLWDSKIFAENFWDFRKKVLAMLDPNRPNRFFAHNARFDVLALNNTCRALSDGKVKYFFPYEVEICDTLKMARQVIAKMPTYIKFCQENGYMTKHAKPRVRLTAEVLYRFISKDKEFDEKHRGKQDVEIEEQIYDYIKRQHKKCNPALYAKKA